MKEYKSDAEYVKTWRSYGLLDQIRVVREKMQANVEFIQEQMKEIRESVGTIKHNLKLLRTLERELIRRANLPKQ